MGVGYFPSGRAARLATNLVAPQGNAYTDAFMKMSSSFEQERSEILAKCLQPERLSHIFDPERGAIERAASIPSGRERLAMLQKALDSFGYKRSKNQRWYVDFTRFFNAF